MRLRHLPLLLLAIFVVACSTEAPKRELDRVRRFEVKVPAAALWTVTDIILPEHSTVTIEAAGSISPNGSKYLDADGSPDPTWNSRYNAYPSIRHCSLIARIGAGGQVHAIGTSNKIFSEKGGRLSLGINDSDPTNNRGELSVLIEVRKAD